MSSILDELADHDANDTVKLLPYAVLPRLEYLCHFNRLAGTPIGTHTQQDSAPVDFLHNNLDDLGLLI